MKRKFLKVTALVLAINFLTSTLAPTLMYALTAGPTAPEYTSFEPIDTTDMVNLATGDFTYNIPLLEVPGPEGGYPLALSYHAGISPEEEASWVGLGWGLNAGAINRIVNVHPDDMKNANEWIVDNWVGGETKEYSLGVGIGPVSVGLTYANDTYKGNGLGLNFGLGIPFKDGGSSGIGIQAGVGPYGGGYVALGVFAGTPGDGAGASVGVGVAMIFDANGAGKLAGYAGVGVSYKTSKNTNWNLLGANISTTDMTPRMDVGTVSATYSSTTAENIKMTSAGLGITIPIYFVTINLGYNSTRYYMKEYENVKPVGTLYPSSITTTSDISFDSYSLKDAGADVYSDPDKDLGGALPAFDAYSVMAQGIGGNIQPYYHELGATIRSAQMDYDTYRVDFFGDFDQYQASTSGRKVGFRFINDFSNSFNLTDVGVGSSYTQYRDNVVAEIGRGKKNFSQTADDFNPVNGMLAGSRHIEWFTNSEINQAIQNNDYSTLHGFIPSAVTRPSYFTTANYGVSVNNGIGGFMITNPSGVTYHYSLPVYNFEEYQYYKSSDGTSTREINKSNPYAYTWLLTAITGPDYVDRDANGGQLGEVDQGDYGYWVKFMYGKWTDRYAWRSPNEGFDVDIDNSSTSYSYGKKEMYYLDAIMTRSHSAIFAKSIRRDGKGVTVDTENKGKTEGRFGVRKDGSNNVIGASSSLLKLDKVLIFNNRFLEEQFETQFPGELISSLVELKQVYGVANNPQVPALGGSGTESVHCWDNIVDVNDFNEDFSDAAERQIVFNYTYDLCKFTATTSDGTNALNKSYNSFDLNYANYAISNYGNSGKLTLNSIETLGRNAKKIIPNTRFSYGLNPNYDKEAVDVWGNYQSDWNPFSFPIYKYTSTASGQNVHAWSLTDINTAIGADVKVNYESDTYVSSIANDWKYYQMYFVDKAPTTNQIRLYVGEKNGLATKPFLEVGNTIDVQFAIEKEESAVQKIKDPNNSTQYTTRTDKTHTYTYYDKQYTILALDGTKVTVSDPAIYQVLSDVVCDDCPLPANYCCDLQACSPVTCPCESCSITYKVILGNAFMHRTNGNIANEDIGGGVRVASIELKSDDKVSITNYDYEGGVTSLEPFEYNFKYVNSPLGDTYGQVPGYYSDYKKAILEKYLPLNSYSRFLPPPGVTYSKVIVSEQVKDVLNPSSVVTINGNGTAEYEFETYSNSLLPKTNIGLVNGRHIKISDYRNRIGLLKKVTAKNNLGDPLSITENVYLHNESTNFKNDLRDIYNNQGKIDQVFFEKKEVHEKTGGIITSSDMKLTVTQIEEYPVIQVNTKVKNYKQGISQETRTLAYDYYTGNPIVSYTNDAYGNYFLTETVPAYTIPEYAGMGLKLFTPTNRHMTLQSAGNYTYTVKPNTGYTTTFKSAYANPVSIGNLETLGLMSASVQTWSTNIAVLNSVGITDPALTATQGNIWRMKAPYIWVGDDAIPLNLNGSYNLADFNSYPFDYATPNSSAAQWQFGGEVNYVDAYSHPLQTSDIYGRHSSTLYDPTQKFVLGSAQNASLGEVAYSGAEFSEYYANYNPSGIYKEGNVQVTSNFNSITLDKDRSHTGNYCLQLNNGDKGFTYNFHPVAGKKYRASAWVYLPGFAENELNTVNVSYKVNGTFVAKAVPVLAKKARSFYLVNLDIDATLLTSSDEITVFCENETASRPAYFDDFRVHPIDAAFTSCVYDLDKNQLIYIIGGDNFYTRFEYDEAGKLIRTYQELLRPNEKILGEQKYNYSNKN
jgi:hypothetical protein